MWCISSQKRILRSTTRLLIATATIFLLSACAKDHSYQFITENDSYHPVERPDANYTSGLSLLAQPAKEYWPGQNKTIDKLNFLQWSKNSYPAPMTLEYGAGQVFYTPDDVAVSSLDELDRNNRLLRLDRPYAGFLYLQGAIHNYYGYPSDWTSDMRRSVSAKVGLTGNGSLAEELHTFVHKSRPELTIPEGWGLQVGQVLGVTISLEQRNRVLAFIGGSWGADVMTNLKASLGNIYTGLDAGATLRAGWNLPRGYQRGSIAETIVVPAPPEPEPDQTTKPDPNSEPFPPPRAQLPERKQPKSKTWHLYGFVSHQNRWVFRDIALDGRLFETDVHTVSKEPVVNEFQYGAQLRFLDNWILQALFAQRSKQFKTQRKEHSFGQYMLMYQRPLVR